MAKELMTLYTFSPQNPKEDKLQYILNHKYRIVARS